MPGPFAPNNTLLGQITHQLAVYIQQQIPSISYVWEEVPDRPPGDNSVMLPMTRIKLISDTNGKAKVSIEYSITHIFRRAESFDTIARAYTYVFPWLQLLTSWFDQTLNGLSISVDANDLVVTKLIVSGEVVIALVSRIAVLTEFNILLT